MGHDVDRIVFLALFLQLLLGQIPRFFDGGCRDLAGSADVLEVSRQGDQDDRVFMGQAEEVEGDEEGDGEVSPKGRFHLFHRIVFEAVEVDGRFFDVAGFHDGDDDAPFFDSHFSRIIALAALVEADVTGIAPGAGEDDVRFLLHGDALDIEDGLCTGMPGFIPVTADHTADFAVGIDDGVDQETGIDLRQASIMSSFNGLSSIMRARVLGLTPWPNSSAKRDSDCAESFQSRIRRAG